MPAAPKLPADWLPDPLHSSQSRETPFSKQIALHPAHGPTGDLEILERAIGADPPARRPVDETKLHEIGLIDLFDGIRLFVDRSSDGVHAHRPAAVLLQQRQHDLLVD